jgi:hypothetical protein
VTPSSTVLFIGSKTPPPHHADRFRHAYIEGGSPRLRPLQKRNPSLLSSASSITFLNAAMNDYGQGPLTTMFVPPSYCSMEIGICGTYGCVNFSRDATCGADGTPSLARACFPYGTATHDLRYAVISYSPMAACPSGWTVGFASYNSYLTPAVATAVGCCPMYAVTLPVTREYI